MNHTQPIVALIRPKIQRTFAYTNYLPHWEQASVSNSFEITFGYNNVNERTIENRPVFDEVMHEIR